MEEVYVVSHQSLHAVLFVYFLVRLLVSDTAYCFPLWPQLFCFGRCFFCDCGDEVTLFSELTPTPPPPLLRFASPSCFAVLPHHLVTNYVTTPVLLIHMTAPAGTSPWMRRRCRRRQGIQWRTRPMFSEKRSVPPPTLFLIMFCCLFFFSLSLSFCPLVCVLRRPRRHGYNRYCCCWCRSFRC